MNDLRRAASALYTLLLRNNIEPNSVRLILRANTEETAARLEAAIMRDTHPADRYSADRPFDAKFMMKLNGITISLATLDRRTTV